MARRRSDDAYSDPLTITVLTLPEAVRKRPGMYFGEIAEPSAKTRLLMQFACIAADAALTGRPVRLRIEVDQDRATISDDGPGLPIEDRNGRWWPELLMTEAFGCHHERHETWVAHLFCSPGIAPSNALCAWLELETKNRGLCYRQRFERGKATPPQIEAGEGEGLTFRFALDPEMFPDPTFDLDSVSAALAELAFLVPELTVFGHQPIELDAFTEAQLDLIRRAMAIDLHVLAPKLERVPLPEQKTKFDPIRSLGIALAAIDPSAFLRFRRSIPELLDHLRRGQLSSLESYRPIWERIALETDAHVLLSDLLAYGSCDDAAVEIDHQLEALL
jgi:hypothetical protein